MRVTFLISKEGLGVPYPKSDLPESDNVGYFDVKKYPDKIALFPEVQGWSELVAIIEAVNRPEGLFRTLRCGVALCDINRPPFTKKISSYVTVAFEILEWNGSEKSYRQMYEEFVRFAQTRNVAAANIIEFELHPTSYNDHSYTGWSIDLWNTGFGQSEKEVRDTWVIGLKLIQEFLVGQSIRYADQLKKGYKTIGEIPRDTMRVHSHC